MKSKVGSWLKTENALYVGLFLVSLCVLVLSLNPAYATVESSIKATGLNLQKAGVQLAVVGFSIGGIGMYFGAQWGYRIAIGTIIGACFVIGGPAIMTFLQSGIR